MNVVPILAPMLLSLRILYALLGAGLHGKNGINPDVSLKSTPPFAGHVSSMD
jgi:hypothetical protein